MFHEFIMNSVSTQHDCTNGFPGYQIYLDHSTIWSHNKTIIFPENGIFPNPNHVI